MTILDQLRTGDMRTIGSSNQVVRTVLNQPELLQDLVQGLADNEAGLRMRCGDVLEKVSAVKAELIQPYLKRLITIAQNTEQQEVQWHMAQIFERMNLTHDQQNMVVSILKKYLESTQSNIVKVSSLQTLTILAMKNTSLQQMVNKLIEKEMKSGAPSVIARGKKLLILLNSKK